MLNRPLQIHIQSLLYKTTISLTGPATIFLVSQMKSNCINNHYKTLPSVGNKHEATYTGVRSVFVTLSNIYGRDLFCEKS